MKFDKGTADFKDPAEYGKLCAVLKSLHGKYFSRRNEICRILAETAVLKKRAYTVLARANRVTGRLTVTQRQTAGISYSLEELKTRIKDIEIDRNALVLNNSNLQNSGNIIPFPPKQEDLSPKELKKNELAVLSMIDEIKKKILQLDLLEMRCRELILAINKSLEAFRHEFVLIRRKIYPYGVFSMCSRSAKGLLGTGYFSHRDMKELNALGGLTSSVLKIIDAKIA